MAMKKSDLTDQSIKEAVAPYGVSLSPELCEQIRIYIATLLRWNAKIALTAVTEVEEILRVHFGESFFAAKAAGIAKGRAADIGTGAGFPGIPIRMANTSLHLTLVEPVVKKTVFLAEVLRNTGIRDVSIIRCRMEEVHQDENGFDFILARALGKYEDLIEWAKYRISSKGKVVLLIGAEDADRLGKTPSWEWATPINVPNSGSRVIFVGNLAKK